MFAVGLYKRNQGHLTRQLSAAALGLVVALGAWTLSQSSILTSLDDTVKLFWVLLVPGDVIRLGVPFGIVLAGGWIIYRLVNYPRFADFLISVEAEMDKVVWSSKAELYRATVVVLMTMGLLVVFLLLFDVFWQNFFSMIGFLEVGA